MRVLGGPLRDRCCNGGFVAVAHLDSLQQVVVLECRARFWRSRHDNGDAAVVTSRISDSSSACDPVTSMSVMASQWRTRAIATCWSRSRCQRRRVQVHSIEQVLDVMAERGGVGEEQRRGEPEYHHSVRQLHRGRQVMCYVAVTMGNCS